jgi:DNA-binding Lrp family transcriptional regulator
LFPGQVERIDFDLAQVECLASPIRSEVFWAFTPDQPQSVAEVALGMGKSAQTVHYHVNELVKRGLLIAVDTRRQYARTEKLFVHAAVSFLQLGAKAPREYRDQIVRNFQAITRTMARENEAIHRTVDVDPSFLDFSLYRRISIRLTPERARALRETLIDAIRAAAEADAGEEGTRVNVSVYMAPTVTESRRWRQRVLGESEECAEDDEA